MAVHFVPQVDTCANLTLLRELFVGRVNAAADRVVIHNETLPGIPHRLMLASVYLASLGCDAAPCRGEETFAWTLETSRQFIAGYGSDTDRAKLLEEARQAMFVGRRAICLNMGDARLETAATVDLLDAGTRQRSVDLSAAWDAMAEAATDFVTDAYDRASARYHALAGKAVA